MNNSSILCVLGVCLDANAIIYIFGLFVSLSAAFFACRQANAVRKQISTLEKQAEIANKSIQINGYVVSMDHLLDLKQEIINAEDFIEKYMESEKLFNVARGTLLGRDFLLVAQYYYRLEQIWRLRERDLIHDDDWITVSSLLKNYLGIAIFRQVFYDYVLRFAIHRKDLVLAIVQIIGRCEKDYDVKKIIGNPFPDPLGRVKTMHKYSEVNDK